MARRISEVNAQEIVRRLVENAFDFLVHSIEEIERRPKYSMIHFYAAVELFLKARLASEHWSLMVAQGQEADWQKFADGDFRSVSLEEAARKLDKIIQNGLTVRELEAFRDVAKHRNRIVHFFHETSYEQNRAESVRMIVKRQLRAWYFLHRILGERWKGVFGEWIEQLENADKKLRKHKDLLQVIFDENTDAIQERTKRGALFILCSSCGFKAQEHSSVIDEYYWSKCWVCDVICFCLKMECLECQSKVIFVNEGYSTCESCLRDYEPEDVVDRLVDKAQLHIAAKENDNSWDLGHCSSCDGCETVVRLEDESYVCANCFNKFEYMSQCGWCGELNTGDMEHSYVAGCSQCDGLAGHTRDE